jgi:hypothetical protein
MQQADAIEPGPLRRLLDPQVVTQRDGDGHAITYLTVGQVARLFPPTRNGRPVHKATVTRWILDGVGLRDGSRLRLRADRAPGGWLVEPAAVKEFLAALTADRLGPTACPAATFHRPSTGRAEVARRHEAEHADRELDRLGFRRDDPAARPNQAGTAPRGDDAAPLEVVDP